MALVSFPRVFANLTTALMSYLDDNFNAINTTFGVATGASQTPTATFMPIAGSDGRLPAGWAGLINVRYLTAGTSYTPTTGTHSILIEMVGGGGAGAGGGATSASQVSLAPGGAAAAYLRKYITGLTAGPFTYAIGAGGTGVSGGTGNSGTATSITIGATTYTAAGAAGGSPTLTTVVPNMAFGPVGSTGTNGDINRQGSNGGLSFAASLTIGWGGIGANGPFGSGGNMNWGGTGTSATGFGAGGGGAANPASTAAATGGSGSAGIIIIYEFA